jgi:hypothetical protein
MFSGNLIVNALEKDTNSQWNRHESWYLSHNVIKLKQEFWTQGPNSWDSICQVWPPAPKCQIKRHGEGRERTCQGKRQSKHSNHPQLSSGYSCRFKWTKELGQGTKVCVVKQSQSQVWFGWSHDWWGQQSWSGKWSGEFLTGRAYNLSEAGGLVQFWKIITWRE